MLFVIVQWLYFGIVCSLFGLACVRVLTWRNNSADFITPSLPLAGLAGLAVLSFVLQFLSVFISLGIIAHLIIIGGCLIFVVTHLGFVRRAGSHYARQLSAVSRPTFLLFFLTFLIVLIRATDPPASYDSGLYHIQAIKWIEQYPAVPGLGNLHGRFAFDSLWFVVSAFFGPSSIGLTSSYTLNGFVFLLAATWFLGVFAEAGNEKSSFARRARGIFFWLLGLDIIGNFYPLISSPSTDQPAMLLIPVILGLALESEENQDEVGGEKTGLKFWWILLLSIFSVLIKLSTAPILLVPFYLLVRYYRRDFKRIVGSGLIMACTFVPFMVRNIILSGYPVYPVPGLDLFNFDWKIPQSLVINEKNWIESWAKIPGRDQAEVLKLSLLEWFPTWWSSQSILNLGLLGGLVILTVVNLGYFIYVFRKKTAILSFYLKFGIIYGLLYLASVYWFLSAPDFRFGYGFLLSLLVLLLLPLLVLVPGRIFKIKVKKSILVAGICWQIVVLFGVFVSRPIQDVLVMPYTVPVVSLKTSTVRDITIYSPASGDQCFDSPLPCTPILNPGLGLRGSDLESGFTYHCQPSNCFSTLVTLGPVRE